MPTDVVLLVFNSLHAVSHCEGVLCLDGSSVRSPGSWQGGSWVSALLDFVLLDTFARSCSVIVCFAVFHEQDPQFATPVVVVSWSCLVRFFSGFWVFVLFVWLPCSF